MWHFKSITNNYKEPIALAYGVNKGQTLTGLAPSALGNASILIPCIGDIQFTDIGNTPLGPTHQTWAVCIAFQHRLWVYRYEGGGQISVTINADGSFDLQGETWPVIPLG